MEARITEVAPDVYRLSHFHPGFGLQFNQYLVKDDEPFLMHTLMRGMFPATRDAIASIIDPTTLRWIGFSHFENDECGALNEWLAIAPRAQAVCSFIGANVTLGDVADRPPRALADGEVLQTGTHGLQFVSTPHVPHCWDAGVFFETSDRTLLCSDLFFHGGDVEQLIDGDIVGRAADSLRANLNGPFAGDMPYTANTDATFQRLAALKPRTLGLMHGAAWYGDGQRAILDLSAVVRETLGK